MFLYFKSFDLCSCNMNLQKIQKFLLNLNYSFKQCSSCLFYINLLFVAIWQSTVLKNKIKNSFVERCLFGLSKLHLKQPLAFYWKPYSRELPNWLTLQCPQWEILFEKLFKVILCDLLNSKGLLSGIFLFLNLDFSISFQRILLNGLLELLSRNISTGSWIATYPSGPL